MKVYIALFDGEPIYVGVDLKKAKALALQACVDYDEATSSYSLEESSVMAWELEADCGVTIISYPPDGDE
jgi:hypothetical protein